MKRKVRIRVEEDPTIEDIDICIRASERDNEIDMLIENLTGKKPEMITATGTDGVSVRISPEDIVSVSVNDKYLQIVTEDDRYVVRQPLSEFEKSLDERQFIRISRYEIVNIDNLLKLGVPEDLAHMAGNSRRGYWFTTQTVAVNMAMTKERMINSGFFDLATAYQSVHVNY